MKNLFIYHLLLRPSKYFLLFKFLNPKLLVQWRECEENGMELSPDIIIWCLNECSLKFQTVNYHLYLPLNLKVKANRKKIGWKKNDIMFRSWNVNKSVEHWLGRFLYVHIPFHNSIFVFRFTFRKYPYPILYETSIFACVEQVAMCWMIESL